eukprot:1619435-Pleurochrysis_carterae.AAC.1
MRVPSDTERAQRARPSGEDANVTAALPSCKNTLTSGGSLRSPALAAARARSFAACFFVFFFAVSVPVLAPAMTA